MEDSRIVELYWQRNEQAIAETESKYGHFCFAVARNILGSGEDARECVNDAFLGAWNAMPPHRPQILSSFLAKITRRLALKKRRSLSADKRGGGSVELSLAELEGCIPSGQSIDESLALAELTEIVNSFLAELPEDERRVFLRRYWYFDSIGAISARFGFGESKVKMMLKRTRDKLRVRLQKEDIWI